MAETESRNFDNRLSDYSTRSEDLVLRNGSLSSRFKEDISRLAAQFYEEWRSGLDKNPEGVSGDSVYTGIGGAALLHHFLFAKTKDQKHLDECISIVEKSLPRLRFKYPSFLCGDAGVLAVGISAYVKAGQRSKAEELYYTLVRECSPPVLDLKSGLPDEVLFGRAGFLYALLFVKRECPGTIEVDDDLVRATCRAVIKSGVRARAGRPEFGAPLYYEWHDKAYLGAAHGFAGILYTLLCAAAYVRGKDLETRVRPTVDYLRKLRYPSGNYPSSLGNRTDRLVHWCHGAPGFVFLFCKAFEVFGDYGYRDAAYEAGATVWERGLLRKGFGVCHGVAGNGYALLRVHQALGDKAFLHRAARYAEFCRERGKVRTDEPDRPLSMFEGLAGTVYFLYDMLDPDNAGFPAFAL